MWVAWTRDEFQPATAGAREDDARTLCAGLAPGLPLSAPALRRAAREPRRGHVETAHTVDVPAAFRIEKRLDRVGARLDFVERLGSH